MNQRPPGIPWHRLRRFAKPAATLVALALLAVLGGIGATSLRLTATLDPASTVWDTLTAIGTLGATVIALWLALSSWRRGRDSGTRLVSAWVTETYEPVVGASHYRRLATLHVANESDEPAFDAHVSVIVGVHAVPLGPLSAPAPIAVLPPRRELTFDLSTPLRAHDDTWNPRASVSFRDRFDRWWVRDENGLLRRGGAGRWIETNDSQQMLQLGSESLENPLRVTMWFLAGLRAADRADLSNFDGFLAPEAPGWSDVNWEDLRRDTFDFQPTSMVAYPAPYIARVKLSGDVHLQGKTVSVDGLFATGGPWMFVTLTYRPERGWRVFGIGSTVQPDRILLADGTFGQPE
ncbi:hypothetical protein [Cellulomonas sp. WB94]|uniref:hypothetical protein n=1 Tax=Cellulomonas sp. WB94 TaxID=2173174 RepID=UPI0011B1EC93|nr:hypothetical protein [Cellulomonas sp. WB94]